MIYSHGTNVKSLSTNLLSTKEMLILFKMRLIKILFFSPHETILAEALNWVTLPGCLLVYWCFSCKFYMYWLSAELLWLAQVFLIHCGTWDFWNAKLVTHFYFVYRYRSISISIYSVYMSVLPQSRPFVKSKLSYDVSVGCLFVFLTACWLATAQTSCYKLAELIHGFPCSEMLLWIYTTETIR